MSEEFPNSPDVAGIPEAPLVCSALRESLRRSRNPDGGWAYSSGKRSRIEPTCWALLALAASEDRPVDPGRVTAWPRRNGWLIDVSGAPPNQAFNALAALTLLQESATAPLARPVIANLLSTKGERYPQSEHATQDNSLQAWSWVEGTASWVEPTAWSLLLLKTVRRSGSLPAEGDARIDDGERLLLDRVCSVGGWNYGNTRVFGHDLWPYVPTTALALLALQDRRDLPSVKRSLDQLQRDLLTERSALALALALVCLKSYGPNAAIGVTTGVTQQLARLATRALEAPDENVLGQATALFALSESSQASKLFSI